MLLLLLLLLCSDLFCTKNHSIIITIYHHKHTFCVYTELCLIIAMHWEKKKKQLTSRRPGQPGVHRRSLRKKRRLGLQRDEGIQVLVAPRGLQKLLCRTDTGQHCGRRRR